MGLAEQLPGDLPTTHQQEERYKHSSLTLFSAARLIIIASLRYAFDVYELAITPLHH